MAAGVGTIDAVLCTGDMTNAGDETALALIWERLNRLADDLDVPLLATAGNHDHSRAGLDPMTPLKSLRPEFPMRERDAYLTYFADNYAVAEVAGHVVIAINSSAFAGYKGKAGEDEYKHGRVSLELVSAIKAELEARKPTNTRILIVHHHPVQLPLIDLNEASKIRDSELLLDALADDGRWLVFHGHKHRPWIHYAPGGGGSAVLFSAGSFAAGLDGVLAQGVRNQFYVVEMLSEDAAHAIGLGVAGTFRSWTLSPMEPDVWVPAGKTDGLPADGGFGWRVDPHRLARTLHDAAIAAKAEVTWEALLGIEPRLPYVSPDDWRHVDQQLARWYPDSKIQWSPEGRFLHVAHLSAVAS